MNLVVLSNQMKESDQRMIHDGGMPGCILMEHAAMAVCELIMHEYHHVHNVAVLCGSGNNGGDGFAVARLLKQNGLLAEVFFAGRNSSMTDDCRLQADIWETIDGMTTEEFDPGHYDLIVDALFGIGLARNVEGRYADLIGSVNASSIPVVAVDMPSGIDADTGHVMGCAVKAEHTVTFSCLKPGLLVHPGCDYCGHVHLADIGIPEKYIAGKKNMFTYTKQDLEGILPVRKNRSNKGSYGRTLIVGGSFGMAGAALLAATAAYRCGCGLTAVLSDAENRTILQSGLPEAIYVQWDDQVLVEKQLAAASAAAIGPGLGLADEQKELLVKMLCTYKGILTIDADALNMIAADKNLQQCLRKRGSGMRTIITPHPGEMARLTGKNVREILNCTIETAKTAAHDYNAVVVLKDDRTIVTDGESVYINTSGCDGMAVGGSGDVLTGMIASMCAQGMDAFAAACAGVYLHGLSGEEAQKEKGKRGMLAGDIAEGIAKVLML